MQAEKFSISVTANPVRGISRPRAYCWLVFIVIYALMLSDYMSRQALNAVFPQLKVEWALSDGTNLACSAASSALRWACWLYRPR